MASSLAKERNLSAKGRTGFMTINRRKKRNMKAKPWGKCTPPGHPSSPTDKGHQTKGKKG